jgi:DNA-binding IclR family transcriptional regulator
LAVLEQLASRETPASHADLVRATGLPKSTLTYVLAELASEDYVARVGRHYALGTRFLTLGYRVARRLGVPLVVPEGVHELLERLARETGETAVFVVEVGRGTDHAGDVLALDHVESPHPMRYVPGIGELQPIAHTAAGHALLAFSGRDSRAIPPETLTRPPAAPLDPAMIDAELQRTRRRGYARNNTGGVTSLAVPWPAGGGPVIGAISIVGPTERMAADRRRVDEAIRSLQAGPGTSRPARRRPGGTGAPIGAR